MNARRQHPLPFIITDESSGQMENNALSAHSGEAMLWLSMEINSLYLINVVERIMIIFTFLNPYQSTVIIIIKNSTKTKYFLIQFSGLKMVSKFVNLP
jgi:hypothetical protein